MGRKQVSIPILRDAFARGIGVTGETSSVFSRIMPNPWLLRGKRILSTNSVDNSVEYSGKEQKNAFNYGVSVTLVIL